MLSYFHNLNNKEERKKKFLLPESSGQIKTRSVLRKGIWMKLRKNMYNQATLYCYSNLVSEI